MHLHSQLCSCIFSASTFYHTVDKYSTALFSILTPVKAPQMHHRSPVKYPDFLHQHCDGQLNPNPVYPCSQLCSGCIQFLCINTVMVNWSQIQCIDTEQMHPAFLHQHSNPLSNVQAATTHWVGNWCGLINILVLDKVGVQKSNEIVDFFVDGFPTDTGALPRLWWVP